MRTHNSRLVAASRHVRLAKEVSAFSSDAVLANLSEGHPVRLTYLNPEKLLTANLSIYENMCVRVDGFFLSWLIEKEFKNNVERASFDFSSLADSVFSAIEEARLSLAIIGAKECEAHSFANVIRSRYKIDIVLVHDGYFNSSEYARVIEKLRASRANVALIGMGGIRQDEFASQVASALDDVSIFTCGAFISQTAAGSGDYYPSLIKKLDLRWLYRFYREPHTVWRVARYYPWYWLRLIRDKKILASSRNKYH